MGIRYLEKATVEKIAAGEVIERPAQVIKELLENSLDAGSSEIEVQVANGGRDLTVSDNGSGIEPDDLLLAVSAHATSKISDYEDLWRLSSFGFRGEALSSIAAVSELTLRSRTGSDEFGSQLRVVFGEAGEQIPIASSHGTFIEIKNLFNNVPARLKFLKSGSAEISAIKNVIKAIALVRPEVQVRLKVDGELVFHFDKTASATERAQHVLGETDVYPIATKNGDIEITGVIGNPNMAAGNARQIWLFVQGRWIQDRGLQKAIMDGYQNLLMHGEYPVAVINVHCPPDVVDVNVHPMKTSVKFRDYSAVYRAIYHTVRNKLLEAPWLKATLQVQSPPIAKSEVASTQIKFSEPSFYRTQTQSSPQLMEMVRDIEPSFTAEAEPEAKPLWSQLQVLAQAHRTYIITENDHGLLIVDQHAAHERVLFESLMKGWRDNNIEVQEYLLPIEISLNEESAEALMGVAAQLKTLGFTVERLGPEVLGVTAGPALIKDEAIQQTIIEMAEDVLQMGTSWAVEKSVAGLMATAACHSAIRAGQSLSFAEMQALLEQMDRFPLSSFCPHGRPVFVQYLKRELERDFGRIV